MLSSFTTVSTAEHEEMRVVSYIQSTTQVMLNLGTAANVKGNEVLRYISACFSVYCEYLMNTTVRIRNAAFQALRLILQQCLKREYFIREEDKTASRQDVLSLDAMSLVEEVTNMRKGQESHALSNADKLIIHLRYLLTSRFEDAQELSLKLMKTFVQTVGTSLKDSGDLLLTVASLNVAKESYKAWTSCIGSFLSAVGC